MSELTIAERIGANMRDVRMSLGLTQESVAELIGIAPRTYRRWEEEGTSVIENVDCFARACHLKNALVLFNGAFNDSASMIN